MSVPGVLAYLTDAKRLLRASGVIV